jgi:hypothetical protein
MSAPGSGPAVLARPQRLEKTRRRGKASELPRIGRHHADRSMLAELACVRERAERIATHELPEHDSSGHRLPAPERTDQDQTLVGPSLRQPPAHRSDRLAVPQPAERPPAESCRDAERVVERLLPPLPGPQRFPPRDGAFLFGQSLACGTGTDGTARTATGIPAVDAGDASSSRLGAPLGTKLIDLGLEPRDHVRDRHDVADALGVEDRLSRLGRIARSGRSRRLVPAVALSRLRHELLDPFALLRCQRHG